MGYAIGRADDAHPNVLGLLRLGVPAIEEQPILRVRAALPIGKFQRRLVEMLDD